MMEGLHFFGNFSSFRSPEPKQWMSANWKITILISLLYFALIRLGQKFMAPRAPFALRLPMFVWNLFLANFSALACLWFIPDLAKLLTYRGMIGSLCHRGGFFERETGFWVWAFAWSKLFELTDTVFLVLRKREVIFLHAYHHTSVFIFTWWVYQYQVPLQRWGACTNCTVHAVMYTYYAVTSLGVRLPSFVAISVTALQIIQMIIGVGLCLCQMVLTVATMRGEEIPSGCTHVPPRVATVQLLLYASYLVLFVQFFVKRYWKKVPKGKQM